MATKKGETERRTKGERVRETIVRKSIAVFAKRGFADASFREISAAAKMKQPAVLHHFPSKYALFEACVDQVLKNFQTQANSLGSIHDDALARIHQAFIANLQWMDEHPEDTALLIFLYYTATHDRHFRALYSALLGRVRERYQGLVLAAIREKLVNSSISAPDLAELIHEHILGSMLNYVAAEHRADERLRLERKWRLFIDTLLRA